MGIKDYVALSAMRPDGDVEKFLLSRTWYDTEKWCVPKDGERALFLCSNYAGNRMVFLGRADDYGGIKPENEGLETAPEWNPFRLDFWAYVSPPTSLSLEEVHPNREEFLAACEEASAEECAN